MTADEIRIESDPITWPHGGGTCKLFPVPREEIDEESDEPDAWDMIWVDQSSGIRRFEVRLDGAYGREIGRDERRRVGEYAASAPDEARDILAPWFDA
jgi:hypothetical protein